MLDIFLTAIALVLVIEGIMPFASPRAWREMMLRLVSKTDSAIRTTGFVIFIIGVIIMCLVHTGIL